MIKGLAIPKLSRTENWPTKWRNKQKWCHLTKYDKQDIFRAPISRWIDRDTVILPRVWMYLYKIDPNSLEEVKKS